MNGHAVVMQFACKHTCKLCMEKCGHRPPEHQCVSVLDLNRQQRAVQETAYMSAETHLISTIIQPDQLHFTAAEVHENSVDPIS